jgi:hypothetical protein
MNQSGIISTIRLHEMRTIIRLLMIAALLAGVVVQGAYAQTPASGQRSTATASNSAAAQKPFRMPASEQQDIADNPSWTAPQKPFRIYGNTWFVGPHGLGAFLTWVPRLRVLRRPASESNTVLFANPGACADSTCVTLSAG